MGTAGDRGLQIRGGSLSVEWVPEREGKLSVLALIKWVKALTSGKAGEPGKGASCYFCLCPKPFYSFLVRGITQSQKVPASPEEEKWGPWSLSATSLWCSPFSCSLPFFKGHNILDGRHVVILGINQMWCTSYLAQKGELRSITGKNRRSVPSRRLCGALYLLVLAKSPTLQVCSMTSFRDLGFSPEL